MYPYRRLFSAAPFESLFGLTLSPLVVLFGSLSRTLMRVEVAGNEPT